MTAFQLDQDAFMAVLGDAVRAPSIHNNQPWRFRQTPDGIEVLVDPARILPATDPTGRGARVSCGAAIYNLGLALAVRGTPAAIAVRPDPAPPTCSCG